MQLKNRWYLLCAAIVIAIVVGGLVWHFKKPKPMAESPKSQKPNTFAARIAPIVFAKCSPCHHPGEAAPFDLLTYDDVRRRAKQIVDVTQKQFMPPWLPKEGDSHFANSRRLSDFDLQSIKEWVDAGMPLGDSSELPAAPKFAEGWQLGTPDVVLETPTYKLTSQDRDVFRNFVIPFDLKSPRWIQSVELRPSNPRVTHHARLGVDTSNESLRRDAEDPEPGYSGMAWGQDPDGQLVLWAPGITAGSPNPNSAWRVFPNSALVLHAHLQPSGKPEDVTFRVGVRYAKETPTQHPALLRIGSCDIDIPAGAKNHTVKDQYLLPIDIDVHSIFPHAHSLCKKLQVVAEKPDGSKQSLITIDHFDESWHESYRYREPVRLPRGTQLNSTFVYDNSDDNPRNRNRPARRVVYGSNVTDEMADVYLQITAVHADQRAVLMEDYRMYEMQSKIMGYRRSLDFEPNNPWSQEALAGSYVGLGQPAKAIEILEQRLKREPKEVFPIVSLGMSLLANGDSVNAEARFREAISMDKQYSLAWLGLGRALAVQKKTEDAEQAFRKVIELAPSLIEAKTSLAGLLMQSGKWEAARDVCASAVSDSPDMASVYVQLAEIYAKMKNYDESLAHCMTAHRLAPYTHPPKVLLAVFCVSNGDGDRALKLLMEAQSEAPSHPVPALFLGQLARLQKQGNLSRDYLTKAAALNLPDNWPLSHKRRFLVLLNSERLQLAQFLRDNGLARDALSKLLELEPHNQQLRQMIDSLSETMKP